jgi:hypothetical protein
MFLIFVFIKVAGLTQIAHDDLLQAATVDATADITSVHTDYA